MNQKQFLVELYQKISKSKTLLVEQFHTLNFCFLTSFIYTEDKTLLIMHAYPVIIIDKLHYIGLMIRN